GNGAEDGPLLLTLARLPMTDALLELACRLADGLAHAHDRGVCHRDLKPANILLADDGEPLLLDFNLSAEVCPGNSATAALIGGTLPYMAPEQMKAFRDGDAYPDFRADIYSIGLILHELLTGRIPTPVTKGPAQAAMERLIADRSTPPPLISSINTN